MVNIIGRKREINTIMKRYDSDKSELIVLYGRIGVGKTYLVNALFEDNIYFYMTGRDSDKENNLRSFSELLSSTNDFKDWDFAFSKLKEKIIKDGEDRKVIFIDEFPLIAKDDSEFKSAFAFFYNSFCVMRRDCKIIISGSASSWIINNVIRDSGELYNRTTCQVHLNPLSLYETRLFLESKEIKYSKSDIAMIYMIFGGIPYYLEYFDAAKSVLENVDNLIFANDAPLKYEYQRILGSLFRNVGYYNQVISVLSSRPGGFTRNEIIIGINFSNGELLARVLEDLILNGMIDTYSKFPNNVIRGRNYHLIDNLLCFHCNVVAKQVDIDEQYWSKNHSKQVLCSWKELAFEQLCFQHIKQIKKALGISGVSTTETYFKSKDTRIDLVINRKDKVLNLCEIRYSDSNFVIDEELFIEIGRKKNDFNFVTKNNKTILSTLISFSPVSINNYSHVFSCKVSSEDLFLDLE